MTNNKLINYESKSKSRVKKVKNKKIKGEWKKWVGVQRLTTLGRNNKNKINQNPNIVITYK